MSLTRYLFHDYWTAEALNSLDERFRRAHRSASRGRAGMQERISELEDEVARLTLVAHSLVAACVKKGVLTHEEIAATAHALDAADGKIDGKVDPAVLRGETPRGERTTLSAEEHLHRLSRSEHRTPSDFLRQLEEEEK